MVDSEHPLPKRVFAQGSCASKFSRLTSCVFVFADRSQILKNVTVTSISLRIRQVKSAVAINGGAPSKHSFPHSFVMESLGSWIAAFSHSRPFEQHTDPSQGRPPRWRRRRLPPQFRRFAPQSFQTHLAGGSWKQSRAAALRW